MTGLKNPYVNITDTSSICYGGNQRLSDREVIKKCGCGIVAAADLIIYLRLYKYPLHGLTNPIPLPRYNKFLKYLNNSYFPLIPKLGMNFLELITGLNLIFLAKKIPLRASWLLSGEKLFERMEAQLSRDFPVILSVGPNFPFIWQKKRLNLYLRSGEKYIKNCSTKAHFVTVTGIDENYIRISSWGRELYISRDEFCEYIRAHSSSFLCNMVQIKTV